MYMDTARCLRPTSDIGRVLALGSRSCALCQVYAIGRESCRGCPLAPPGSPVDSCGCGNGSPYQHFSNTHDPEPLIAALEAAAAEEALAALADAERESAVPASWEAL